MFWDNLLLEKQGIPLYWGHTCFSLCCFPNLEPGLMTGSDWWRWKELVTEHLCIVWGQVMYRITIEVNRPLTCRAVVLNVW